MARLRVPWGRGAMVALAGFALLHGLLYTLIIPPWQAPDEPQHLQYALLILESPGQITREQAYSSMDLVEDVHYSLVKHHFWFFRARDVAPSEPQYFAAFTHPPLFYTLAALILVPLRGVDLSIQLYVLRVLSVLLTTGVVLITFHVARRLFPREPEVICAVTAVVLFLPMHTFVGASANNDALAELIGSLAILLCVDLAARGLSLPRLLALGLVSTLALLTKRTTLFVVILSLLVSAWSLIRWIWQLGLRRALSGLLLLVVLLAVVRNAGEGLPLLLDWEGQRPAFFPTRVSTEAKPYQVFLPYMVDESLPPPTLSQRATNWLMRQIGGRVSHWVATEWAGLVNPQPHLSIRGLVACLGITFASFWGNFGWLNVPLSLGWYSVLLVATAISVAGLIRLSILLARKRIRCNLERRRGFAVVLGAAVLCSAQLLGTMVARVQPQQGRYLFPALPAFAILLVLGWFYVVPSRWRKGVPWLVTVGLVLLDTVALVYTIIPFYYG